MKYGRRGRVLSILINSTKGRGVEMVKSQITDKNICAFIIYP